MLKIISKLKYQRWTRPRIIERIQQLHQEGADLSWRAVSLEIDPPLAAAALRPNGFPSWRAAITAAGLDINEVARYKFWDQARVITEIQQLHRQGTPLSSKAAQENHQPLFCAARRRFGSWDNALAKAGLNAARIRLRRPATAGAQGSKPTVRAKAAAAPSRQRAKRPLAATGATTIKTAKVVSPAPSQAPAPSGAGRAASRSAVAPPKRVAPHAKPSIKTSSKVSSPMRAPSRRNKVAAPA